MTTARPMAAGSERILVVDDDDAVREAVADYLRRRGYDVTEAASAVAGLARLRQDPMYDLLLTDVVMPWPMSGQELGDEVGRRWPRVPVLYMSSYSENAVIDHGLLRPGADLLAKPFSGAHLAAAVRRILDGAVGLRASAASRPQRYEEPDWPPL